MSLEISSIIKNNTRNELLNQPYAAIDIEYNLSSRTWDSIKKYNLYAVAIVDSLGNIKVKHESDFYGYSQPEKELVKWAMNEILQFRLTIGWYSKGIRTQKEDGTIAGTDSDLKIIDDVCKFYNIPSIIAFDKRGIPYVRGFDYNLCKNNSFYKTKNKFERYYHIDLFDIYKKQLVMGIYRNKFKNLKLDSVCKALLGEGKFEGIDGQKALGLEKEKQIQYVIQDASLVIKLAKNNNYEILDLMNAISLYTDVPFEQVCHTGVSNWWDKIIRDKIRNNECRLPTLNSNNCMIGKKRYYIGGRVIDPKVGYYYKNDQTVYVLDVKSLYPTLMINNNISFDTVNCSCCKNNPDAQVPHEIISLIDKNGKHNKSYWICKDPSYRGIIPRLLEQYRNERFRQKEIGDNPMQLALKTLINSCYGVFGSDFFEFADYRVAELTTAFGRQTLSYMKHIAEEVYGFEVIYGDTDSIFITNVKNEQYINKFLAECSIVLEDIEIELEKVYRKMLLLKKKHYIGIHLDKNKEPDIKGIEGIKSDRPLWINNLQKEFVDDIANDRDPAIGLRKAYVDMERGQVAPELLAINTTLKKEPSRYPVGNYQRIVGNQLNAKEGNVIKYYKSDTRGTAHSNPIFIDIGKYLEMMQSTFEEQLKVLGYDFQRDIIGVKSIADY